MWAWARTEAVEIRHGQPHPGAGVAGLGGPGVPHEEELAVQLHRPERDGGPADGDYFTTLLTLSPAGDALTVDFAKALLDAEGLGQGADHGGAEMPLHPQEMGIPSGYVHPDSWNREAGLAALMESIRNSFSPSRSGDVFVVFEPGHSINAVDGRRR